MKRALVLIAVQLIVACGGGGGGGYYMPGTDDGGGGHVVGQADMAGAPPAGAHRVFITSATYSADLKTAGGAQMGLAGADAICQNACDAASLNGKFKAWISDSNTDAISRLTDAGPWYMLNGMKAFNNKAGLGGQPQQPIVVTEQRTTLSFGNKIWTGTSTGGHKSTFYCRDWSYGGAFSQASDEATVGSTDTVTEWTEGSSGGGFDKTGCIAKSHLYCFEQ